MTDRLFNYECYPRPERERFGCGPRQNEQVPNAVGSRVPNDNPITQKVQMGGRSHRYVAEIPGGQVRRIPAREHHGHLRAVHRHRDSV